MDAGLLLPVSDLVAGTVEMGSAGAGKTKGGFGKGSTMCKDGLG